MPIPRNTETSVSGGGGGWWLHRACLAKLKTLDFVQSVKRSEGRQQESVTRHLLF